MRRVSFYRDSRGKCPVEELDVVPGNYLKKLVGTTDLWEVRARTGSNAYRLLCFVKDEEVLVLTNGFRKKSQKTPRQEIALAERRKTDWIRRNS